MKNKYLTLGLIAVIGCGGWLATTLAQRSAPFDVQQTRKELEILEGILSTTLKYAADSDERQDLHFGVVSGIGFSSSADIESFYLYGQGAVFFIPNSRSRPSARVRDLNEISEMIDQIEGKGSTTDRYLKSLESRIENSRFMRLGVGSHYVLPPAPPDPPEPPEAPAIAPRSEDERIAYSELWEVMGARGKEVTGEELDEWIRTQRSRLAEEQREAEQRDSRRQERAQKIQDDLITALAQHGDSLSALGADEYISLIFLGGSEGAEIFFDSRRGRAGAHTGALVIAIQKSQLTQFNRGAINMEQLRSSLIEYEL